MTPEELVGQRITQIRDRVGLTQQQLGEAIGELLGRPWPRQTVSAAEKGKRSFTAAELVAIAQVLDTWPGRLFIPTAAMSDDIVMPTGTKIDGTSLANPPGAAVDALLAHAAKIVAKAAAQLDEHLDADRAMLIQLLDLYETLNGRAVPVGTEDPAQEGHTGE